MPSYAGTNVWQNLPNRLGMISQALMGIRQRDDQEAEMARQAAEDAQRSEFMGLQMQGLRKDLSRPDPVATPFEVSRGGISGKFANPEQALEFSQSLPAETEDVNWQTQETAEGFVQVNPRTGQIRRLQGMTPRERATGDQYNKQLVETANGFVWADPRTQEITPVDRSVQPKPAASTQVPPDAKLAELEALVASPSAQGDVALIMAYNKLLDPQSTVREGEFATVSGAGSWKDRAGGLIRRFTTGERLTQAQREDILDRARAVLNARSGATPGAPAGGQDPDALIDQMIAAGKSDAEIEAELRRLGLQ